ncbi:hypothetical protein F4804DRAFT_326663 [Jackrogersella minutella]|nr:hypothetical protein F4804DRAFT_326663 [Jackrogersella minutella]
MAPRKHKTKTKSGCRTCKARRVKCDEGWPSCSRCISTGRVCEGYGIWGGGGNQYGHRAADANNSKSLKVLFAPTLIEAANKDEGRCLEWFTYRTSFKLPGTFKFAFWDKLVFQVASDEPAVLHAVLALGSAHKRESLVKESATDQLPDEQEQFTLQHYSKAITSLQPHFSAKNNSSVRVGLIACLVFITMEFLRGHYKTGIIHLENGLKLLEQFQARSSAVNNYSLFLEPCCNSVDAWIIQAFIRLDVQAKLLGLGSQFLTMFLEDYATESPSAELAFPSMNHARQHLDRLLSQIFHLSHECRLHIQHQTTKYPSSLLARQRYIKAGLAAWYKTFRATKASSVNKTATIETICFVILRAYHLVAEIMVDTCLQPTDQLRYDEHTETFISITDQMKQLRSLSTSPELAKLLHFPDMSNTVSDLGAIPALYYIAVKCRVRRMRHDALKFLHSLHHKEGIWNSPLVACIAGEVVRIEEGGFYTDFDNADEVSVSSNGTPEKIVAQEPILPESYRLHDIEIELPEDYAGVVILKCKRNFDACTQELITREFVYKEQAQRWVRKDRK